MSVSTGKLHCPGQGGYVTPAALGIPTASERGAKSEVAHLWARCVHTRPEVRFCKCNGAVALASIRRRKHIAWSRETACRELSTSYALQAVGAQPDDIIYFRFSVVPVRTLRCRAAGAGRAGGSCAETCVRRSRFSVVCCPHGSATLSRCFPSDLDEVPRASKLAAFKQCTGWPPSRMVLDCFDYSYQV